MFQPRLESDANFCGGGRKLQQALAMLQSAQEGYGIWVRVRLRLIVDPL
jgi:hypothetical protein